MNGKGRSVAGRIALVLAAIGGGLVLLVVALVLLVDSNVATRRAMDLVLPRVSAALGREVTVKDAKLRILPNPRVSLAGLAVAGRAGEPALVEADALDVEVRLWPLLRSLGKQVEVRAFTLVRPSVNLVRARDGTWNYEALGAAGAPPPGGAPQRPASQPGGAARVAVSDVAVSGAAVRMIDRGAGKDDTAIALEDIDVDASGVGFGLPLRARVAAALAGDEQNLHADIAVARLPEGVPQKPEDWPEVQGSISLGALAIDRIRSLLPGELGAIVRGGTARLDAKLATDEKRTYRIDGTGELKDVRLRGQPASGRFRAAASWAPARPDAARVDVTELALRGPGVDLGGNVSLETAPLRASFALAGPLLDLDAVMGLLPEAEPAAKQPPAAGGDLVPEATRRQIEAATARGTIAVGEVRAGRIRATGVKTRATLRSGTLTLEQMDASVFGGRVSAAGTRISLAQKEPAWNLAASLSGLDLGEAIKAFAGRTPLLAKIDGKLDVAGTGTDWAKMRNALTGLAELSVQNGTLTSADLGGEVLGGIAKGLAAVGRGGLAKRLGRVAGGKTTFKDLSGKFDVKDGFLGARSPFELRTDAGVLSLGGRLGLDGRLDLEGGALVPRKALSEIVSGIPLPESVEVPLGLRGTLSSPSVSVRGDQAVSALLQGQARRAAEGLRQEVERSGRKKVEGLFKRYGGKR
jgi:AsmA protein